jgi:hypothetical protein
LVGGILEMIENGDGLCFAYGPTKFNSPKLKRKLDRK